MTTSSVMTDLLAYNFNLDTPRLADVLGQPAHHHIGQSFMHELAREGDTLSAEVIMLAGGEIDFPDDEGRRPLHEAAFFGRMDMVKFLVQNGAVIDAPLHPFGYTALYYAVQQGHHDIAAWLLTQGARRDVADRLSGQGLLHMAAARGDTKMAGILIAAGIDTLTEDRKGQTARDYAAKGNHKALEKTLLKVMMHHAQFGGI